MIKNLYEKLVGIYNSREMVRQDIVRLSADTGVFSGGSIEALVEEAKNFDPKEMEAILSYRGNPYIDRRFNDPDFRLVRGVEELAKPFKGFRFFAPKKRDEVHERRRDFMGELVYAHHLKKRNWAVPDNIVTGTACAIPIIYGLLELVNYATGGDPSSSGERLQLWGSGVLGVLAGTVANVLSRSPPGEVDPIKQARYIDQRISFLFGNPVKL